jgi:hypothetical protein
MQYDEQDNAADCFEQSKSIGWTWSGCVLNVMVRHMSNAQECDPGYRLQQ